MKTNINRHSPNLFGPYREIHETVLYQFRNHGFIGDDTLEFKPVMGRICLSGEIACLGKILITVLKYLKIMDGFGDTARVQTVIYSYNASIQGYGNILRYDNQDEDYTFRNGHLDEHHKHIFDWRTDREDLENLVWVGYEKWPTLGDVIQEMEKWYWQNHSSLPYPDSYPVLGVSRMP